MSHSHRDILKRWRKNPILDHDDMPFRCNTIFNAAVVKRGNTYVMLLRVEDLAGHSVGVVARSAGGYHFTVDERPTFLPSSVEPFRTYEALGVEDPRMVFLDGAYHVMYTAYSHFGPRLGLAKTTDFKTFDRIALVSAPDVKNGLLFPRKIKGRYVRLDRPIGGPGVGNVWISYSPDLIHWGNSKMVFASRPDFWDSYRIGGSVPPIETGEGWLEIYHGIKMTSCGPIYRLGAILLDLDDPSKVIARSAIPILSPRELYERIGDICNVVYSCGAVVEDDGEVKVYYGAADTHICLATAPLHDLIDVCVKV